MWRGNSYRLHGRGRSVNYLPNDCEFCRGDDWENTNEFDQFDGLRRLEYHYTTTETKCSGMACRKCVEYAVFSDDEIIVTHLEGVRQ